MIIDAGIHAYRASSNEWPWVDPAMRMHPAEATGEQTIALMDESGVDGTIIVSTWRTYGSDTGYAEAVQRSHPDRIRLVAPIIPEMPGIAERVREWSDVPGAVGIRLMFLRDDGVGSDHLGVAAAITEATAVGMPVNIHCTGRLDVIADLATRHPDAQLVLDQVGMTQPFAPPAPQDPFVDLGVVLELARFPNVALKFCGALTYSRQPFPHRDLWEPLGQVLDQFGAERCMWGTDWQRTTEFVDYDQTVRAFRHEWPLGDTDRAELMGGTAVRLYRWFR